MDCDRLVPCAVSRILSHAAPSVLRCSWWLCFRSVFFISVLAKNQFAASQIALLITFLPAFLLSGFLFAIDQMPVVLQWITRILPARYYVSVLKQIFLKGTPTPMLAADLFPLAVFTLLLALVATRSFHKRLE